MAKKQMPPPPPTPPAIPIQNVSYDPAVPVSSLKLHPLNPRQGDVGAIYVSIELNGFFGAVIARQATREILVGNHRYIAACQQEAETVPVIWLDMEEAAARKILLVDNRANDVARYDDKALAEVLTRVRERLRGLAGTGYDEEDFADLLKRIEGPQFPEYDVDVRDEVQMAECPSCGHEFPY